MIYFHYQTAVQVDTELQFMLCAIFLHTNHTRHLQSN